MEVFGMLAVALMCGFPAFALSLSSIISVWQKDYREGLFFAILELLPASVVSGVWMYALKISGKSDWFLFGLFGYTPVALSCICMIAAGVVCFILNARGLAKQESVCEGVDQA